MADPIKQFAIKPIIPLEVAGFDISFTNSSLWMAIATVVLTSFFIIATHKKALLPNRTQAFAEMIYEFIASMIRENTGPDGKRYFSIIFTVFMVVLMGNVLGLIPYSFTFTSHIIVTGLLAMLIFVMVTIFGILNHGTKFFTLFAPAGVPLALQFLIVPIELLSFLIKPVTLSVRLFANMMAGHLLLKVFAGFSAMAVGAGLSGVVFGMIPMAFNIAVYALELLVACLQAYIFAILASIYLKDTVDLHH